MSISSLFTPTPKYIHQIKIAPTKQVDIIKKGAPTPAGPCCTVGSVADEITSAVENIANAGGMGKHIPLLSTNDGKLHVMIDGGLSSNPGMGAVTGFSIFAAVATLKASIETIREQNSRINNAKKVLEDIQIHQECRKEAGVFLKKIGLLDEKGNYNFEQGKVEEYLGEFKSQISKGSPYSKLLQDKEKFKDTPLRLMDYLSQAGNEALNAIDPQKRQSTLKSPKQLRLAVRKETWIKEKFLKPIQEKITAMGDTSNPAEKIQELSDFLGHIVESCQKTQEQKPYETQEEIALKTFLKEGIIESRAEKIIPGYLASAGISLIALGRFVPLATPLGQFIMSAYSAGNLKMSYRDFKYAKNNQKLAKDLLEEAIQKSDENPAERVALNEAKKHYGSMKKWAAVSSAAWALNTAGMLTMGTLNTIKWAVALAAAPISAGLSISAAALTDTVSSLMTEGMLAATAAVASAALVCVPGNLKLRSRNFMSLKPPKSWEKEKLGQDQPRNYVTNPFSKQDLESRITDNLNNRETLKKYRKSFFESIELKGSNRLARLSIKTENTLNNIMMWGGLGLFSNYVMKRKFKAKIRASSQLNISHIQKQLEVLGKLAGNTEENQTEANTPEDYINAILKSNRVGDIAKLFSKNLSTKNKQGKTIFNQRFNKRFGDTVENQDVLELMEVLNNYGPCCDTTYEGVELVEALKTLFDNTGHQKALQKLLFNATNQYLVYQLNKELKEEKATWMDLYMNTRRTLEKEEQASQETRTVTDNNTVENIEEASPSNSGTSSPDAADPAQPNRPQKRPHWITQPMGLSRLAHGIGTCLMGPAHFAERPTATQASL